ncbi:MAG: V-type ATP synthase subunit D [Gammaproteobacteria bacterium]|jgi:V/A-type H+-transporting ATPase subunit D
MLPDLSPTRAALLELGQEQRVVSEAYAFLDEKRLLLAAELLRQLARYQELLQRIEAAVRTARQELIAAVQRHGLQELSLYPAAPLDGARIEAQQGNVMGVTLLEGSLAMPETRRRAPAAGLSSPEAEHCREAFAALLPELVLLAGVSGNLYRLLAEYRRTERRARALENVILPEIEQALAQMTSHLEEMELEDAVRTHLRAAGPAQTKSKQ